MVNTKKKKEKFKFKLNLFDEKNSLIPSGNVTYLIAFFIPLCILIALYFIRSIFPFGEDCYLRSDMYHQYAPFFAELWNKLRNGESLTYSWDIGMGVNFTSLYAYYLSSPSNWFIFLFPKKSMIEIMNVIIILKLCLSSVTFTYYITKRFNKKDCTIALFGVFYALSGYIAAYSWNIMWLDCILILPLIILGLEKLVNENKGFLYCISLGFCIYTNYYISIMVCLSVIMYFFVLIISYDGIKKPIIYIKKFLSWCVYSLLAGGLAACLLLPEFYTFSLSASSDIAFPKQLEIYFSIMEMAVRQLVNVPIHMGLDHFPNIYCGVAVFLFIPLYIMDKKVNAREKIGKLIILLMFLLAFNMNVLNFIWHGFHYPNSLPCRQSFIYIFFLLSMSYEAFEHIKSFSRKQITAAISFAIGFVILAEQIFIESETYENTIFYISGLFIILYAIIIYIINTKKMKTPFILFLVSAIVIIESLINMDSTALGTTSRTSYLLDYDAIKSITDTVKKEDSSFYRMDKVFGARTKNDGSWHNYHTISTFSSTCSAGMTDLYTNLGLVGSANAYGYDGSTVLTNSLFSVKYLISNKVLTSSNFMQFYTGDDGEFIYKNNYTLPLGYVVSKDAVYWSPNTTDNKLQNQNSLAESLANVNNLFELQYDYHTIDDVDVKAPYDGNMYVTISGGNTELVSVTIDGVATSYKNLKNNNHIIDVGYVTTSQEINISADDSCNMQIYMLNSDKFINFYNQLNSSALNIDKWSNTKITGTVDVKNDGVMLFSIPFDGGWSVYVDGKKVESYAFDNALLAIDITSGQHNIKLKFVPRNLILGCIITMICIIILIAIWIFKKKLRLNQINISKLSPTVQMLISNDDIYFNKDSSVITTVTTLDEMNDFDNLELEDDDDN